MVTKQARPVNKDLVIIATKDHPLYNLVRDDVSYETIGYTFHVKHIPERSMWNRSGCGLCRVFNEKYVYLAGSSFFK
jgi:hypothetical protein